MKSSAGVEGSDNAESARKIQKKELGQERRHKLQKRDKFQIQVKELINAKMTLQSLRMMKKGTEKWKRYRGMLIIPSQTLKQL